MSATFEVRKDFIDSLELKIADLRLTFPLKVNQISGYRFKSNDCTVDAILSAVIIANQDPRPPNIPIQPNAVGLTFDPAEIASGRYDLIIKETLSSLSSLDFISEHRIDLH